MRLPAPPRLPLPGERALLVAEAVAVVAFVAAFVTSFFAEAVSDLLYHGLGSALGGVCIGRLAIYYGRRRAVARWRESSGLVPVGIIVSTTATGSHVATVERENGELLSLEIPDWIEGPGEEFVRWLLSELLPGGIVEQLEINRVDLEVEDDDESSS